MAKSSEEPKKRQIREINYKGSRRNTDKKVLKQHCQMKSIKN